MVAEKEKISILFKEIQNENRLAFEELYQLYFQPLSAFALHYVRIRQDAEEISSELFVRIWLKRSALSEVLSPEVYLFVSIKNACLNFIRTQNRKRPLPSSCVESYNGLVNHDPLANKELQELLNQAVGLLPPQRRIIFELIKYQGLKSDMVAGILGLSVRTVENQLYKAVKTLAEAITHYLGYNPRKKTSGKRALPESYMIFFF